MHHTSIPFCKSFPFFLNLSRVRWASYNAVVTQRSAQQQLFDSKSGTLDYKFEACVVVLKLANKQLSVNIEQHLDFTKYSV